MTNATDAVSTAPSQLQIQTAMQLSDQIAAVVAAAGRSVVAVHGGGRRPSSGIVWQPGIVVAAEETVARDDGLAVTLPDGTRVGATLAGRDPSTDLAVLRCETADMPAITALGSVAPAADPRAGHLAVAVGRADGDTVATLGIISRAGAAWRSSQGGLIDARLMFDAWLPGSSEGGALLAADGGFIGMAVFGPRRRVLAIPVATIARIVPQLQNEGHISRGYLGVGLQGIEIPGTDGAEPRRAAIVMTLSPSGPAHSAGILQGDIIMALGGMAVTGTRSLYQLLGPDSVGQTRPVELVRAGARSTVDVTIAARPRG